MLHDGGRWDRRGACAGAAVAAPAAGKEESRCFVRPLPLVLRPPRRSFRGAVTVKGGMLPAMLLPGLLLLSGLLRVLKPQPLLLLTRMMSMWYLEPERSALLRGVLFQNTAGW